MAGVVLIIPDPIHQPGFLLTVAALRTASAASEEEASPPPLDEPPRVRGGPPTMRLLLGSGAVGLWSGDESSRRPGPAKLSSLDSLPQRAPISAYDDACNSAGASDRARENGQAPRCRYLSPKQG